MLQTLKKLHKFNKPFYGINSGNYGFLMNKFSNINFVKNLKRKNRTVKQAGFLVLRNTYMPSVLVELGFLTNKKEGSYLNSKKGQKDMSKTIADAIIKYKKGKS